MANQFSPGSSQGGVNPQRQGFSRDGVHFYWLANYMLKNTKLTERFNLQFRSEMFDVFNHPNFGNPALTFTPTSTTFGKITSTRFPTGDFGSARQIQFALKLLF